MATKHQTTTPRQNTPPGVISMGPGVISTRFSNTLLRLLVTQSIERKQKHHNARAATRAGTLNATCDNAALSTCNLTLATFRRNEYRGDNNSKPRAPCLHEARGNMYLKLRLGGGCHPQTLNKPGAYPRDFCVNTKIHSHAAQYQENYTGPY